VYLDQAALVVRLLGKPIIRQNDGAGSVRGPESQSKRAIKVSKVVNFLEEEHRY
jgi:hypothetical protein